MYETTVTLQGYLGTDVTAKVAGEHTLAQFRVGCTPRRFHRASQSWTDGPTQWYSVTAWRQLADHCLQSLRRGDPVVVHGRLTVSTWVTRDGVELSSMDVEALQVGHDLSRGTSVFTKAARPTIAPLSEPGEEAAAAEAAAA
jgi:single-strand DNA-binding protein